MLISDWSSDVCSSDLAVQSLPPPKLSVLFFTSPDPVTIVRPVAGLISLIPAATRFFLPPRPPNALNSAPPIGTFDTMLLAAPERTSRSEEHTSELQSLMRISYAVFCLKKKNIHTQTTQQTTT